MAKPNYAFAKRQRDLAKQQKREEKRLRKLAKRQTSADGAEPSTAAPGAAAPETSAAD